MQRIVDQADDDARAPNTAHQATCPYCQTALRDLREAWDDVQTLACSPVPIPAGLTARIMLRARDLARRMYSSSPATAARFTPSPLPSAPPCAAG